MKLLIGRDPETSRLLISVDGVPKAMSGDVGSVPKSVSREHCSVEVDVDNKSYIICNENPQNSTFINGVQVEQKSFNPQTDVVELSYDRYKLNTAEIISAIIARATPSTPLPSAPQATPPAPSTPQTYSITHLEGRWKKYHDTKLEIQIKEKKSMALRSVTGLFSMSAVACGFIPGIADIALLRVVLYALGFFLMAYFFVISYRSSSKNPLLLDELDQKFHDDYVCPNPKCGHFLGYQPYNDLKRRVSCPYCRSNYTHKV